MRISAFSMSVLALIVAGISVSTVSAQQKQCVVSYADIGFILDGSGSVGSSGWDKSLNFVVGLINGFEVAKDKVRIGMISFGSTSQLIFDFNRYGDKSDIITAAQNAGFEGGSTATNLALDQARTELFQEKSGMRPGVPHILIVLTDGESDSESATVAAAKALQNENISVFAVGVGNAKASELKAMASKPEYVYNTEDFDKLGLLLDTFKKETCKEIPTTTPRPTITLERDAWMIGLQTGSVKSDSYVYVKLNGDVGAGHFQYQDNQLDNHEANSWDYIGYKAPYDNIGRVQSVDIKIRSGSYSVKQVVVTNTQTGEVVVCAEGNETFDSAAPLTLPCSIPPSTCITSGNPAYLLLMKTGDDGFEGTTHIKLVGSMAETPVVPIWESTDNDKTLAHKALSTHLVPFYPAYYPVDIGEITDVQIKNEPDSSRDPWELESILLVKFDPCSHKPVPTTDYVMCTFSGVNSKALTSALKCERNNNIQWAQ